jgi:hypothetical protein
MEQSAKRKSSMEEGTDMEVPKETVKIKSNR